MAAQNPTYQFARFSFFLGITLIVSLLSGNAYSANLTLAWDANNEPDLLGYHVFCGESSGNYTVSHDITSSDPNDPPPTTCDFTGLEEGKKYYFAAIAYSENGQSDYSQEISYTVPVTQNDPDVDQDGYTTAQGDCNDSDPAVHPGAEEICGDGIDQNCSGADFACPDDHSLVRDAETGVLSGAFEIGSDPAAISGQYVYVPNGVGTRFDGPDETHKITYTFNLLEEGTYRIKGAVYAANGSDDSFWVKVNDNPAGGYLWDVLQNTGYLQDYVNDRNGADPVEVWLPVGENTVTVYLREDGTRLGTIELEPVATAAPVADEDGDGYTESQGDCDDNSATVYPGADEICSDGIDQDCNGSDSTCIDLTQDSDNDGLTDYEEENTYFTDPYNADTDGDGFSDGEEIASGFDPTDQYSKPAYGLVQEAEEVVLPADSAFKISSDPAASNGQYVYVPNGVGTRFDGPDENHKIIYTFNLLEEGTYRIKGTVYAANGSDDSFWVKVNDSPAGGYLWDVSQNTSYLQDYVNDRNGADPVEVWLPVGENTVTVYLREDGTRLDIIELEPLATAAPVSGEDGDGYTDPTDELVREAEDFDLPVDGDFEVGFDSAASGGAYVYFANGTGRRLSGPDESQKFNYTFYVPKAGTYQIKGAVYAANSDDDSFWIRVNDSPTGGYLWDVLQNSGYQQDYVNDRYGADPVEVSLEEGPNTITVYLREDGTRLDKIELEPVD